MRASARRSRRSPRGTRTAPRSGGSRPAVIRRCPARSFLRFECQFKADARLFGVRTSQFQIARFFVRFSFSRMPDVGSLDIFAVFEFERFFFFIASFLMPTSRPRPWVRSWKQHTHFATPISVSPSLGRPLYSTTQGSMKAPCAVEIGGGEERVTAFPRSSVGGGRPLREAAARRVRRPPFLGATRCELRHPGWLAQAPWPHDDRHTRRARGRSEMTNGTDRADNASATVMGSSQHSLLWRGLSRHSGGV